MELYEAEGRGFCSNFNMGGQNKVKLWNFSLKIRGYGGGGGGVVNQLGMGGGGG